MPNEANNSDSHSPPSPGMSEEELAAHIEDGLHRIAHMFLPFREDQVMRELCRLAVKSVQERWIRG